MPRAFARPRRPWPMNSIRHSQAQPDDAAAFALESRGDHRLADADADYRYDRTWIMQEVRRLSVVDDWRNALLLVSQWIMIIGAGTLAIVDDSWVGYVVAALFIGTRLQVLAVLMHDG